MTKPASIFSVSVAHGEYAKGNKTTTSRTLDRLLMGKSNYRIIKDGSSKDGPYFCAADFGGEDRGNANIEAIRLLALDIDSSTREDMQKSIALLKADNVEFICYTTASHNPELPVIENGEEVIRIGYRLILLAPRDLNISEYRFAIDYVNMRYKLNAAHESRTPSQAMYYPTVYEANDAHKKFMHYIGTAESPATAVTIPDEVLENAKEEHDIITSGTAPPIIPPRGIDQAYYLSTLLEIIDPSNLTYNEWRDVSFAIHHQTFGNGMELWNNWSARDNRYNPNEMAGKWASFKESPHSKGITLRTILNWEVARGITNETRLIAKLVKQAETGHVLENLRVHVVEETENGFLKGVNTNIAKAYCEAKKRLFDIDMTMGEAQHELRSIDISDEKRKFFVNNYVYVSPTNEYFELASGHLRNSKFMDDKFSRDYGTPDGKGVCKPITAVLAREAIYDPLKFANGFVYEPQSEGQIVQKVDGYYINEFKHNEWHVIGPNDKFDPELNPVDRRVHGIVNTHFEVLSDGRPEVKKFLMQYLGHLRQKPGTRIHHALCITSSAQGIGKSITQKLFEAVLGESNVGELDKKTLAQANFNSYVSARKMIQVIDEFDDLSDRRSAEILTSLKSAITSNKGPVSYKGKDAQVVDYYSSYMLFSNNRNVLNGEGGRRWSQFDIRKITIGANGRKAGDSLEAVLGRDREEFFNDYLQILREFPDRLAAMFDAVDLEGFKTNEPLIMKREEESTTTLNIEGVARITFDEMLLDDHQYVKNDIIKVSALQDKTESNYVEMSGGDTIYNAASLRKVITTMLMDKGYSPIMSRKRINGMGAKSQHRPGSIYIRGDLSSIMDKYHANFTTPNDDEEDL